MLLEWPGHANISDDDYFCIKIQVLQVQSMHGVSVQCSSIHVQPNGLHDSESGVHMLGSSVAPPPTWGSFMQVGRVKWVPVLGMSSSLSSESKAARNNQNPMHALLSTKHRNNNNSMAVFKYARGKPMEHTFTDSCKVICIKHWLGNDKAVLRSRVPPLPFSWLAYACVVAEWV